MSSNQTKALSRDWFHHRHKRRLPGHKDVDEAFVGVEFWRDVVFDPFIDGLWGGINFDLLQQLLFQFHQWKQKAETLALQNLQHPVLVLVNLCLRMINPSRGSEAPLWKQDYSLEVETYQVASSACWPCFVGTGHSATRGPSVWPSAASKAGTAGNVPHSPADEPNRRCWPARQQSLEQRIVPGTTSPEGFLPQSLGTDPKHPKRPKRQNVHVKSCFTHSILK